MTECYYCKNTRIFTEIPIQEGGEGTAIIQVPVCRNHFIEAYPEEAESWQEDIEEERGQEK